jgi:hypothetical protein
VAIESAADDGKSHGGESLDHRMKYLKARARHLATYANLMVSHARLLNTVGRDEGSESGMVTDSEVSHEEERSWESVDETPTADGT